MEGVDWQYDHWSWSWNAVVRGGAFSGLDVTVETDESVDRPTPLQLRTFELVSSLSERDLPDIDRRLHDWTEELCDAELLAEYEDEDYEFEIESIKIPRTRGVANSYFLAWMRCELECEHGIGLACRAGTQFAVCHPDQYRDLDWDDVAQLDAPFRGE